MMPIFIPSIRSSKKKVDYLDEAGAFDVERRLRDYGSKMAAQAAKESAEASPPMSIGDAAVEALLSQVEEENLDRIFPPRRNK